MKMALRFQSEQEFQNFFSQLCSADIPSFMAVEGAGGDGGFDGINETTAYQVYFPEEKNRKRSKYIEKINKDLTKVLKTKKKLGLEIKKWILVVPEDLDINVISHLLKKGKETGIICTYWGATKLLEMITKYPHIQDSFPTIFLPPVRDSIKNLHSKLTTEEKPKVLTSVEIISEYEYQKQRKEIEDEYTLKINGIKADRYTMDKATQEAKTYADEATKRNHELNEKKYKSDKAYDLEREEIIEYYEEQVEKVNDEMNQRGLSSSGIKDTALGKLDIKKTRDIERLNLKFGKTEPMLLSPKEI